MNIYFSDQQTDLICKETREAILRIASLVVSNENQTCDELSVSFVSKEEISKIHDEFYGDPSPTDCCSFPIDPPGTEYRVLGDVVACPKVAIEASKEHHTTPYEELTLYIIHGLLHLLGYDDIDEGDRECMESLQEKYLSEVKSKGLLLQAITT